MRAIRLNKFTRLETGWRNSPLKVTKIRGDRGANHLFDIGKQISIAIEDKAIKPGPASLGGRVNEL